MFNLSNIIQVVTQVVVAVVNAVTNIIQNNSGGQNNGGNAISNFFNWLGGGSHDDDDSDPATRPSGPSPEELRRREQDRKAQAFDDDIDRQRGRDDAQDEGDAEVASVTHRVDLRPDIASLFQGEPSSAELQVAAAGNPIAQALLQMLRHERSQLQSIWNQAPSPIACMISTFGLAAEDDEDTIQAAQLCEMALSGQSDTDGQIYLAYAGDNLASLFAQSEIDPCEGLLGEALDRCQNVERLRDFGVTVDSASTGEFSVENLQTLNTTVAQAGSFMARQAAEAGYDLTPEEAFQTVFGNVEFIYDPTLDKLLGTTEGQTIRLHPGAFDIADTLVPAHELAHIFQNRLGETKNKMFVQATTLDEIIDDEGNVIGIEEKPEGQPIEVPASTPIVAVHYVIGTGGQWYPFGMPIWEQDERGRSVQKKDEAGNLMWNIEPGRYNAPDYDPRLQAAIGSDSSLFFNERREQTDPTEGFADTLAILTMRGRDLLFDDPRGKFFDEQMPYWIRSLIEPTRYPFPAPLNALEYENEDRDNADDEQ